MCVNWTGKWRVTKKSMIAYKKVMPGNFGEFLSPIALSNRRLQDGSKQVGSIKKFHIGKVTKSGHPGIYLYRDIPCVDRYLDRRVIKVRIPAGTEIRLGEGTINAVAVLPLEVV